MPSWRAATRSPATACAGSTTRTCPEATERRHVDIATRVLKELTGGAWPLGWYTGRDSPNTRRLVVEHGGYDYDSDYYGDDLPFWMQVETSGGARVPHLVVPYALDTNDMRFVQTQGFNTGDALLPLPARRLRRALCRRRSRGARPAEDDVDRHALPPARQARAASVRCGVFSTTWRRTSTCGSRAGSTSRGTGEQVASVRSGSRRRLG